MAKTTKEQTTTTRTAWPQTTAMALVPLAGTNNLPAPTASAEPARKWLLDLSRQWLATRREQVLAQINEELKDRDDVRNLLCARDFFLNAPKGAMLFAFSTDDPVAGLQKAVDGLSDRYKLIETALLTNLEGPVDDVCRTIHQNASRGVMIHVMAPVAPGTYEELVTRQIEGGLLGDAPGRDAVMAFVQQLCDVARDGAGVTAHTMVGAALGKRLALDLRWGMAEPMAGDRNQGDGPQGGLVGGSLVQTYTEEQRAQLSTFGLNTARDWHGVGNVVLVTNRSLLGGDGHYSFGSPTRLRQQVQAIFHETAERNVQNAGKREGGPLEKTMGDMNVLLTNLVSEGWLKEGLVTVDYSALTVNINVVFVPVMPIDSIVLEYRDAH